MSRAWLGLALLLPALLRPASGSDFLRADLPARPAALAGAYAAQSDDAASFGWNPAALGNLDEARLTATYLNGLADTQYNHAALALPWRGFSVPLGLGLQTRYAHTADFQAVDANGQPGAMVSNYDLALGLALGAALNSNLRLGLGVKGWESRLAEFRSRGLAADLGLQTDLASGLTLGLSLADLGAQEAYDLVAETPPSVFRLAMGWALLRSPSSSLRLLAQLSRYWDPTGTLGLGVGAEYQVASRFHLRAGWRVGVQDGPFSLGAGFAWEGFGLDYAYQPFGELGAMHRVSLEARLGVLIKKAQEGMVP